MMSCAHPGLGCGWMRTGTPSLRETDSACRCQAIEERGRKNNQYRTAWACIGLPTEWLLQETHGYSSEILPRTRGITDDQHPARSKGLLQVFPSVFYRGVWRIFVRVCL